MAKNWTWFFGEKVLLMRGQSFIIFVKHPYWEGTNTMSQKQTAPEMNASVESQYPVAVSVLSVVESKRNRITLSLRLQN